MRAIYILLLPIFLLTSCGPSDEEIIEEAEIQVQNFVDELSLQNFNSATEIYEDFDQFIRYNLMTDFSILRSQILSDEEVKVTCSYIKYKKTENIQFTLKKKDGGMFKIQSSKGLSHRIGSNLYNLLKRSGCLTNIESDIAIENDCRKLEPKYTRLISDYVTMMEEGVVFEPTGSNLTNNYNISVTGEIMMRNNTDISIPGFSYETYINLYDRNKELIHTQKYEFNSNDILANNNHQFTVFTLNYYKGFKSFNAQIKITDDRFLENIIAQSASFDCSEY